jgi:hypothetical protein
MDPEDAGRMTNEPKSGSATLAGDTMPSNFISGNECQSGVIWRCDGLSAGRLYSRSTFGTREEAEKFGRKMRRVEPDQMFIVEGIPASALWN